MIIEDKGEGVFFVVKGAIGDRRELRTDDNFEYIISEFVRFKKEHPALRIVSVTPLIETVNWVGANTTRLANMGYMIITESETRKGLPCGCRCLVHGNVDDC